MNDRPQGGSAYDNNRIELMINRRGFTDDGLGMQESLNEKDLNGNGLNVTATFYVAFNQRENKDFLTTIERNYFKHY